MSGANRGIWPGLDILHRMRHLGREAAPIVMGVVLIDGRLGYGRPSSKLSLRVAISGSFESGFGVRIRPTLALSNFEANQAKSRVDYVQRIFNQTDSAAKREICQIHVERLMSIVLIRQRVVSECICVRSDFEVQRK